MAGPRAGKEIAKRVLGVTVAVLTGFVVVTWWALEWNGVAVVETRKDDGSSRSTHVWYAETGGELWVEAGTPLNPWYLDLQSDASVTLSSAGPSGRFIGERIEADPSLRHFEMHSPNFGYLRNAYDLHPDGESVVAAVEAGGKSSAIRIRTGWQKW